MWNDLDEPWKIAFEEAWTAFCNGSTPIGGVLCAPDGTVLMRDRNRGAETGTLNRRISHAEVNILNRVNSDTVTDLHSCVLYTTMEPCPMCMGTCVMSNIRHLRFASRDPYCGFTHLAGTEPYFLSKRLDYTAEGGQLEFIQLTIQSIYEYDCIAMGKNGKVLARFDSVSPDAVKLAGHIHASGLHNMWKKEKQHVSWIFDKILKLAEGSGI